MVSVDIGVAGAEPIVDDKVCVDVLITWMYSPFRADKYAVDWEKDIWDIKKKVKIRYFEAFILLIFPKNKKNYLLTQKNVTKIITPNN